MGDPLNYFLFQPVLHNRRTKAPEKTPKQTNKQTIKNKQKNPKQTRQKNTQKNPNNLTNTKNIKKTTNKKTTLRALTRRFFLAYSDTLMIIGVVVIAQALKAGFFFAHRVAALAREPPTQAVRNVINRDDRPERHRQDPRR